MSRFWAGANSSDSDSDDDSDASSSESSDAQKNPANRWAELSDSESSSDEGRVVVSGKERAMQTFQKHIKNLRQKMKDRDYYAIQTEFDELAKAMIKAKQYLATGVPRPLVRILVDLEDYNAERLKDKEQFKKLSARQGRALNKMKLTLKKHNKAYEVVMNAYRENPDTDDPMADDDDEDDKSDDDDSDEDDSDSDDDDSDDEEKKPDTKAVAKAKESDSDENDDDDASDEWGSDSSSSDSDSDDGAGMNQLKGRARWLKKTVTKVQKEGKTPEDMEARRKEKEARKKERQAQEAVSATKSILPEDGLTASLLNRKVAELAAQRGRRGKDNRQLLRELEALYRLSVQFGPRVEVPVLMHVISAQFGLQRTLDDYMDTAVWKACASYLSRMAALVEYGYRLVPAQAEDGGASMLVASAVVPGDSKISAAASASDGALAAVAADEKLVNPHTGEPETADERAERLRLEREEALTEEEKKTIPVIGSLQLHLTRLEEEYVKSLQKVSHHSADYVSRLRDESMLVELLAKFQAYFERTNSTDSSAILAQLRIEHLYYRHDSIARQVDKAALFARRYGEVTLLHPACATADAAPLRGNPDFSKVHPGSIQGKPTVEEVTTDFTSLLADLCSYVYKHGTEAHKIRAMICQICHHAIHDRFTDARDLLLMSHLQDTIYSCGDVTTMVLFNRMMVNVGMCAFRIGRINDAHQCLTEICSGRVRELLAQGVNAGRFADKTAEQEKAEKRRQIPYHQHINLDLLEACHLISAMLLEVPNMAASAVDGETNSRRGRVLSRTFRKFYDQYNHQVFTGPPEQTRDFVMRASKALIKGDWKTAVGMVKKLEVWKLVPGEGAADRIAEMLTEKIKLEGLRTYLFAFSAQYDSLSLSQLCGMFEMTKTEVHSVVSKMMIHRELYASWDQPTETIVLRRLEPTSLQVMALQFAEKAALLVESNERLLDAQTGNFFDPEGGDRHHHRGHHHWKKDDDDRRERSGGGQYNRDRERSGGGQWQNRNTSGGSGGGQWQNRNTSGGSGGGDRGERRSGGRGGGRGRGRGGRGNRDRSGRGGGRGDNRDRY